MQALESSSRATEDIVQVFSQAVLYSLLQENSFTCGVPLNTLTVNDCSLSLIFAPGVCVPQGLGQWSTAQFNSCEQQQKFLRLMGGFKKGFQPATGSSTGGANMAMGKEAQQQLQQGLLGEFERAHSRRMDFTNRGAGLGFTAPSNKKFFIDINASRSVRFDD